MSDFEVVILKPDERVDARKLNFVGELKPTKLFVLPTGSVDNKPSYCWQLENEHGEVFLAQISDRMFKEGVRKAFSEEAKWNEA